MRDFRNLKVWEKAHKLVLHVYKLTEEFPREELFGLVNQTRRSAVSIPSNIAEGCGRNSKGELARFMDIARGSASELEYQFLLARDLKFIKEKEFIEVNEELMEIQKMLTGLIKNIRKQNSDDR